jgi:hypothetical protein
MIDSIAKAKEILANTIYWCRNFDAWKPSAKEYEEMAGELDQVWDFLDRMDPEGRIE